jgi:anti-sigma factor RsiW
MTSHEWCAARLSDYLDDELSFEEHAAVGAHVAACPECSRTLEDLRQVIATAATLSPAAPRVDLWDGIAERLEPSARHRFVDERRRVSLTLPQLAAASLLIATLSGGVAALLVGRTAEDRAARQASAPATQPQAGEGQVAVEARAGMAEVSLESDPDSIVPAIGFADAQYDAAVADLERALRNGRGRLDPDTVLVVEENLAIIDRAIAEARDALGADPSNGYLSGHLMEARRRKLDLLRRAAELTGAN